MTTTVANRRLVEPVKRLNEGYGCYFITEAFVVTLGFFFANPPDTEAYVIAIFAMLAFGIHGLSYFAGYAFKEEVLGPNLGALCAANLVVVMGLSAADPAVAVAAAVFSLILTVIAARLVRDDGSNFFLRFGALVPLPLYMFLAFFSIPEAEWYVVLPACMAVKLLLFLWIRRGWPR